MAKKIVCSECGTADQVKPARDYTDLAGWLAAWNSLETSGDTLLCPSCAAAVVGDLSGQTSAMIPFDFPQDEQE
jgi:hypothetical protein